MFYNSKLTDRVQSGIVLGLVCLLCRLVLTQGVPELTLLLRGVAIPENEVLDKEDLGTDEPGALSVVTPYSGALSFHYPFDDVPVSEESIGFFWISSAETFSINGSQIIRLRRRRDDEQSDSQEGIWRCSVPSNDSGGRQSIYFGLYSQRFPDRGVLCISSGLTLTAVSSLLTEPPTITLTANTTGGPPGNVQWTIDGAAIPDSTATVNIDSDSTSDRENARYTHTLMVRGRQSGVIRFTASNNRTSPAPSRQLTITFPDPPTNVQTSQVGEVRVKVTWNRPMLTSTVSTSGYAIAVNSQSPTTVPAQTLSQTLVLGTGTHDVSVESLSTIQGHQLYSTKITDTVEILALPTPSISSISALSSIAVRVQWTLSSGSGHKPAGDYIISYTRHSTTCSTENRDPITVDGSVHTRDIDGLEEFSMYTVRVTAVYRFGGSNQPVMKESGEMEVQTLPAAPSSAPQGFTVQTVTSTSVVLTWNELDCLQRNGDITGYMIRYVGDSQNMTESFSDTTRTYTVQGLVPFTEYSFSVAAVNTIGAGPFTDPFAFTVSTSESIPGKVNSLTLSPMFTSVDVIWSSPVRPNGIITQYEVSYTINTVTVVNTTDNSTLEFTISSLEPGTSVIVTVRAFTRVGAGETVAVTNSTLTAPPPVQNVVLETINSSSVRVRWDPIVDIPEITGYRVYYHQLTGEMAGQSSGTKFRDVDGAETSTTEISGLAAGVTYYIEVVGVAFIGGPPLEGVQSTLNVKFVAEFPKAGCQYVGAVVGTALASILLYTVVLLFVLLVCVSMKSVRNQHQRKQSADEDPVYDVVVSAEREIPLEECTAYTEKQMCTTSKTQKEQEARI